GGAVQQADVLLVIADENPHDGTKGTDPSVGAPWPEWASPVRASTLVSVPVDPKVQELLADLGDAAALSEDSVAEARERIEVFSEQDGPGPDMADVEDRTVPGPDGELPIR